MAKKRTAPGRAATKRKTVGKAALPRSSRRPSERAAKPVKIVARSEPELPSEPEALTLLSSGDQRHASVQSPTVVAVGASAGGLEAFSQILENLSGPPNLAFVFLQHLS